MLALCVSSLSSDLTGEGGAVFGLLALHVPRVYDYSRIPESSMRLSQNVALTTVNNLETQVTFYYVFTQS